MMPQITAEPPFCRRLLANINGFFFVLISAVMYIPLMYMVLPLLNVFRHPSEWAAKALPEFLPTLFFTYGVISAPAAWLLWKIRPSRRIKAYVIALLLSFAITLIELVLGTWNFLAYFLYFGAGSLLLAPIMTYNAGPLLWAAVMAELRWQIHRAAVCEPENNA